jgi:hypothetical protein
MPVIFSICFIVQLIITQHEAKEKLEQSMLQTVHLKKEEFSWHKKGKRSGSVNISSMSNQLKKRIACL